MDDEIKETAEKFVNNLLTDGKNFQINPKDNLNDLPTFCNKELFKRGQRIFLNNPYSILMTHYLGLLVSLSIESSRTVLRLTGNSSTPFRAYRRYVSMVRHIINWYFYSPRPNSRFWKSLNMVNKRHKSVHNLARAYQQNGITQKDLALMQFSFIGVLISRPRQIGFHSTKNQAFKGINHTWYVLGNLLGLEDRFNICRSNVEETRAICNLLIETVFLPAIKSKDEQFIEMSAEATNALWYVDPVFQNKVYLNLLYEYLMESKQAVLIPMTFREKCHLKIVKWTLWLNRWIIFRWFINCIKTVQFCYFAFVPFVAAIRFGWSNAVINVFNNNNNKRQYIV